MSPLLLLALLAAARAQEEPQPPKEPRWSVSLSLPMLRSPVFEATVERALGNAASVALIGGGGPAGGRPQGIGGVQGRAWFLGDFQSGFYSGGEYELRSGRASVGELDGCSVRHAVGPFAGGKHRFAFGLTIDGRAGLAWSVTTTRARAGEVVAATERAGLLPFADLSAGWTF